MTSALEGLTADRAALLEICANLDAAQWEEPSGCPGWRVQDVVSHLGALFWVVVDPAQLPEAGDRPTEEVQDLLVEQRRAMTVAEVLGDYEEVSRRALEVLATFEGIDTELAMGDLGTYPISQLVSAFAFDHFVHIRFDLFAPRGSLPGPVPPSDTLRLAPAMDWVEAALPQQSAFSFDWAPGALEFIITGPGSRTFSVGTGEVLAQVSSGAETFVRCITGRASWDTEPVSVTGGEEALKVLSTLHVF
jgi:uncharacterized protein (TIGR03083 family)